MSSLPGLAKEYFKVYVEVDDEVYAKVGVEAVDMLRKAEREVL